MRRFRGSAAAVVAGMVVSLAVGIPSAQAVPPDTTYEIASVSTAGVPATGQHLDSHISSNGRYVSFDSDSTTVVAGASGLQTYVRDRTNQTIEQATVANNGSQPNGGMSFHSSRLSKSGRQVEFVSYATNLVTTPVVAAPQTYLRDLDAETTEVVSVGPNGEPANHPASSGPMSSDGRYVFFTTWATNWAGADPTGYDSIWLRDRLTQTTSLVLQGNSTFGDLFAWGASADGNVLLFQKTLSSGMAQLWVLDRSSGASQRVDVDSSGTGSTAVQHFSVDMSDDGNVVAFDNETALDAAFPGVRNQIYVRNISAGTTNVASLSPTGAVVPSFTAAVGASISGDGTTVGFSVEMDTLSPPGGWDPGTDVYARDLVHGSTWHVAMDGFSVNSGFGLDLNVNGKVGAFVGTGDAQLGVTPPVGVNPNSRYVVVATRVTDSKPPVVSGTTDLAPGPGGWFRQPPTISWTAFDPPPSDGFTASNPPDTLANLPGLNTYTSDPVCDVDGHCATGSLDVGLDQSAPTADITEPADGATYALNQSVAAAYSCSDIGDAGIFTCAGTPDNGSALDTSSPGAHALSVTATDNAGNVTTVQHDYTVLPPTDSVPPTVTITSPVDGSFVFEGDPVTANYSCDDGSGSGVALCSGPVASGSQVDTGTPGARTFTVNAQDVAGNPASASVTYNVIAPLDVADTFPAGGGSFTSDTGGTGPTPATPVQTGIDSPVGGAVEVTQSAITTSAPTGYQVLGVQENITAPLASDTSPLVLRFSLDASLLADAGLTVADVAVLRDGLPIGSCADSTQVAAIPDPCVFNRQTLPGGDGEIDIYSVHASTWNFAAQLPTPPLSLTTATLAKGTVGVAYTQPLAASGGAAPYVWSVASGALPAGLTLNPATGVVSGVPKAAGTFALTLKVADATLPTAKAATHPFSLVIAPTAQPGSAKVGVPYWTGIPAFRGTAPYRWTVSSGQLPPGLSLDSATGTLSGTPTREGIFAAIILITDSHRPRAQTAKVAVLIAVAPAAIAIGPATLPSATRNVKYAQTLTASGGVGPYRFRIASGSLPGGLALSSSGALSGKPTRAGTSTFAVAVADAFGFTATRTYSITVH